MKCAKCVEQGLTSKVYVPTSSFVQPIPVYPFYDESGEYHRHDASHHSTSWSCSNGHRWHRRVQHGCSVDGCEWNKTAEDTISWDDDKPRAVAS